MRLCVYMRVRVCLCLSVLVFESVCVCLRPALVLAVSCLRLHAMYNMSEPTTAFK